jgi:hypothetical protein
MAEDKYLPMLVGELFNDRSQGILQVPFIIRIMRIGQSAESRQFRFQTGFLYIQFRKSQSPPAAEAPPLVAAPVHCDPAEPWIKGPVDIKGLQRKIDLTQDELQNIIRIGCRPGMPGYEAQQLMLVFPYQILKCQRIAILAPADQCAILQAGTIPSHLLHTRSP